MSLEPYSDNGYNLIFSFYVSYKSSKVSIFLPSVNFHQHKFSVTSYFIISKEAGSNVIFYFTRFSPLLRQ